MTGEDSPDPRSMKQGEIIAELRALPKGQRNGERAKALRAARRACLEKKAAKRRQAKAIADRNRRLSRDPHALAEELTVAEQRRLEGVMRSMPGASAAHRGTKSTHALTDLAKREVDAPRERLTDGKRHPVTVARVSDSDRIRP